MVKPFTRYSPSRSVAQTRNWAHAVAHGQDGFEAVVADVTLNGARAPLPNV